jgi:deazaflavin-dependent oxidoreductase (nitroreductase family)
MKARNTNPLILIVQWLHVKIYQWSGGRIGTRLLDMPILILNTTGRKTGRKRARALTYAQHKGDYFVVASNGGSDFHPLWWLNLLSEPMAEIEVNGEKLVVLSAELSGKFRQEIWELFVAMEDRYTSYEKISKRIIPVVQLISGN